MIDPRLALRQTWAIFVDAYRELNARKLFWIVLALSGLVVGAFAMVGLSPRGVTVLWKEFEAPEFNSTIIPPQLLYKFVFVNLGIKFWLGMIATVLALISTAGMIPEFVAGGSVELTLSKPIGRLRLFLTKYATGLMFVALQVTVFTAAAFLLLGLRGKSWEPRVFLAVPITVGFFSYLYAMCALLGLVTRSAIASLLLTMLFWVTIFGVHATEALLLESRVRGQMRVEAVERYITHLEAKERPATSGEGEVTPSTALQRRRDQLVEVAASAESSRWWHRLLFGAMTVLPKTTETVDLLNRSLLSPEDLAFFTPRDGGSPMVGRDDIKIDRNELVRRLTEALRSRSVAWVVGTSLAFEVLVLVFAAWIFSRRDF
jgi:ABC-type transport system involved in multi-copper enzyme maturation permease subunit